jgi:hypothetical protein
MLIGKQVANDVRAEKSGLRVISGQEFDRAEPVSFGLPICFEIILAVRPQD